MINLHGLKDPHPPLFGIVVLVVFSVFLITSFAIHAAETDKPVKLALVGAEANGDLAALLSSRLSSYPGIFLVERSELPRLATEKQLQEFAAGDGLSRAFDLLHADGLIVLEKAGRNGPLALRLFSTHNGLRLWSVEVPEKDPRELIKMLADAVVEKAPKCLLPLANASPVAVINLRAATFSLSNAELETKLTRLLEMQLDAAPGIVLLERRRLREAQWERDLSAAVPESLQASVLLVDGSFVGGVNGEEISLNLRVREKDESREAKFKAKPGEMSRLMQEMAPFDPSGKKGPYNLAYAANYAPVWAASVDDLLSFYNAYINSDHPKRFWVFKRLLRVPAEALGRRFLSEEEARKMLVSMGESWRVRRETELFGWMMIARHGDPEASAIAYRTYLNLLTERAVALEEKGELGNYLQAEWNDDGFRKRFGRERTKGLLHLFGVSRQFNEELVKEWFGRGRFEPQEAKEVWAAQQAYRQRVLAAVDSKQKGDHTQGFNWAEGVFLTHYPEAANPATSHPMNALIVSRFWCAAGDNNLREFGSNSIEVAGDDAWMMGGWNGQPGGSLIKISLPELRAQDYPTDISGTGGKITLAGEMIYVLHGEYPGGDKPMEFFLSRFDPASGKWEKRPFQNAYKGFFAGSKLYFNLWNPHGQSRFI